MTWGHYTLVEDELDEELLPLALQRGIGVMNAAPLMQGLLTEGGCPSGIAVPSRCWLSSRIWSGCAGTREWMSRRWP